MFLRWQRKRNETNVWCATNKTEINNQKINLSELKDQALHYFHQLLAAAIQGHLNNCSMKGSLKCFNIFLIQAALVICGIFNFQFWVFLTEIWLFYRSLSYNIQPPFFFHIIMASSLFILDVSTESQKNYELFNATYILCNKKKIEGTPFTICEHIF